MEAPNSGIKPKSLEGELSGAAGAKRKSSVHSHQVNKMPPMTSSGDESGRKHIQKCLFDHLRKRLK